MIRRSPPKLLKTVTKHRTFTQATATLRLSPNRTEQVQCRVEGAPYYSVMIPKSVGCGLAGRDLGSQAVRVNLIFYGGCHFAYDNLPRSPRLTLTQEVASLLDKYDGPEMPAVLFHGGNNEGSAITLKGSDGEEMWHSTASGAGILSKALQDMK